MSSLSDAEIGTRQLEQFSEAIERGEFLMMVDVPRRRVEEIEKVVIKHHPGAKCMGTESVIPPFP